MIEGNDSGILNHVPAGFASEKGEESSQSGMVLALVLILMSLAAAIVIHSQVASRLMLRRAQRSLQGAQLRVAATDAALGALLALEIEADLNVNHTNEAWAAPERILFENGIETITAVRDEQRLFDINNLSATFADEADRRTPDIVAALLESRGADDPAAVAAALREWFVEAAPGKKMIESPAQLGRIAGLDFDRAGVGSVLTVMPFERSRVLPVNVNTAPRDVLAAVMGETVAEAICGLRDAQPIMTVGVIEGALGAERFSACRPYLDVKSRFFSVRAKAALGGHEDEVFALAHRDDKGRVDILRWIFR